MFQSTEHALLNRLRGMPRFHDHPSLRFEVIDILPKHPVDARNLTQVPQHKCFVGPLKFS